MFGNHAGKKLSAYLHGELRPEEARRVSEHLSICPKCRAEFEEIKFSAQMVQTLAAQSARAAAPEPLWEQIALSIEGQTKGRVAVTRRRWSSVAGVQFAGAFAVVLLISAAAFWFYRQRVDPEIGDRPSWEVTRLDGKPAIGRQKIDEKGRLAVGQWLVTDGASRAQISVGQIGEVKVEPNSRVRLVEAHGDEHRLALQRGKMEAFIWAPPRQFFVDTPSAVAVDLGCSYTLEVNDDGQGLLRVTMGWVAFEWKGVESFVPAGAMCVTRPGRGPGTPYFSDASTDFQNALALFDTTENNRLALETVLGTSREHDALTLWHLLSRASGTERGLVYDRLAKLLPPPPHVTREGVLGGDRTMLDAWWDKLGLGDTEWWRMWKGPLPSQTK